MEVPPKASLDDATEDDVEKVAATPLRQPSNEAMAKLEDYRESDKHDSMRNTNLIVFHLVIPYLSDEHADAATKNSHLKLVFRLTKFYILDDSKSI